MPPTGADRDLIAIVINLKEERYLQKCLQTIDMERKYTSKLLELDLRILKIYLKRLRKRISQIKSNLSVEEICQVRELESQGKLGNAIPSAVSNSALKIAAAYRYLKLDPDVTFQEVPKTPVKKFLFELDESIFNSSVNSEESAQELMPVSRDQNGKTSLSTLLDTSTGRNNVKQRPLTSVWNKRDKQMGASPRPKTAPTPVNRQISSHVKHANRDSVDYLRNAEMAAWHMAHDSDADRSHFGENQFEEKRKRYLQSEANKSKDLNRKTKDFLDKLDIVIPTPEKNPRLNLDKMSRDDMIFHNGVLAPKNTHPRETQHSIDFNPVLETKEDYQKELIEVWKDLNKCRYLRVSDDMIDLSGMVTLARDHMKQFSSLNGL